jgi:hypothetical protein
VEDGLPPALNPRGNPSAWRGTANVPAAMPDNAPAPNISNVPSSQVGEEIAAIIMLLVCVAVIAFLYYAASDSKDLKRRGTFYGCISGGCAFPFLLFLLCCFMHDTGGPLIWPLASVFFGTVFAVLGRTWGEIMKEKRARTDQAPPPSSEP